MKLIGKLDSHYVRRCAIAMALYGLEFEHVPLSVFGDYDAFRELNPVVRAPTLLLDNGAVLSDSNVILSYCERSAPSERKLIPDDEEQFLRHSQIVGAALAVCDKSVQLVYELDLRSPATNHRPWSDRLRSQLAAALVSLDRLIIDPNSWLFAERPMLADVTAAVAIDFACRMVNEYVTINASPGLMSLRSRCEEDAVFKSLSFDLS